MSIIAELLKLFLKVMFAITFEVSRILVIGVVWLFGLGAAYLDSRRRSKKPNEGNRR